MTDVEVVRGWGNEVGRGDRHFVAFGRGVSRRKVLEREGKKKKKGRGKGGERKKGGGGGEKRGENTQEPVNPCSIVLSSLVRVLSGLRWI